MRCLILLIALNLVYIASIFEIIKFNRQLFLFNFTSVIVMLAIFFLSAQTAAVILVTALALALSLLVIGIDLAGLMPYLVFLALASGAAWYLRYSTTRTVNIRGKVLETIKEEHKSIHELNKKIQENKLYFEKAVYDITSLYQAPKEMISSMTVDGLLECLRKSMEGYFSFSRCRVIIFSFKENTPKVERAHNIPLDKSYAPSYEEALVSLMSFRKDPIAIDRNIKLGIEESLNLPSDIGTFIAAPLAAAGRTNGILCIENLPLDDMLRFMILAHQFALVLERIRLHDMVQELAIRDGLTGVFVRRYFMERLNEESDRARRFNTQLSFVMADIDNFKECNDKYGHLVGDVILKEAAAILRKNLREIDIIGRYGGEEFSIILPETSDKEAVVVAERLRSAVSSADLTAYDEKINITMSFGLATFPDHSNELSQLIDKADQMLYKAKDLGRNKVVVYE